MSTNKNTSILIAGAGIGGMTAALALRSRGYKNITVVEQASELKEVGAGIQLGPNAVKILTGLGLIGQLEKVAVAPEATQSRDWASGRIIRNNPLGEQVRERYGAPYYHVHRADLHTMLVEAFGRSNVRLNSKVASFQDDGTGVSLTLADGTVISGDVLIGCDGVHSVIAKQLFGQQQEPKFTNLVAWRGMVDADRVKHLKMPKRVNAWWGPHRHVVCYYVSGAKKINWVGFTPADEWRLESWSARGDKDEVLEEFAGWHPELRGLIENTDEIFKWALYDREPMPSWGRGRVTLLGDAAHAMVPFLSQGGAQSIEDGHTLALAFEAVDDPVKALRLYEDVRRPRTAQVQLRSRAAGNMYHETGFMSRLVREMKFRWARMGNKNARWTPVDWLYGYECETAVANQLATPQVAQP